jgi:hypothetical protein
VIVFGALILTAINSTSVFCIEEGSVNIESTLALCCAVAIPGGRSNPFTPLPRPVARSPQCARCLDVPLGVETSTSTLPEKSPARNPCEFESKWQTSVDDRWLFEGAFRKTATVGHSGSDLAALRTIRLLT